MSKFFVSVFVVFLCSSSVTIAQENSLDLEFIQVERFTATYSEFLATLAALERNVKKGGDRAEKLGKNVVQRGIEITQSLVDRANQIRGEAKFEAEYKEIHRILETLVKLQKGQAHLVSPFIVITDTKVAISELSVRPGLFNPEAQSPLGRYTEISMNNAMRWKGRMWRAQRGAVNSATHFGATYSAFMIATGMLTFVHLSSKYNENPVALDQYLDHATDPLGAVSFAAFMATSSFVTKSLNKIKMGAIPRAMIPYVGMSAGLVASSLFYELMIDRNLKECITSGFKNDEACDMAFDTWVIHKKIYQYTPAIISLSTSVAAAGGISYGLAQAVKSPKATGAANYFRGITLGPKATVVKEVGETALKSRYVASIGTFFLFLAIEKEIGPPIYTAFERYQLKTFDVIAWADQKIMHRDYWRPDDPEALFYIQDVFDVEATNLPTAHEYFTSYFDTWKKRDWEVLDNFTFARCYAEGLYEVAGEELKITELDGRTYVEVPFDDAQKKPESMRRCEVFSQPERIVQRHAEVEASWRLMIMRKFYEGLMQWVNWSGQFSDDYINSYFFYDYFMQAKWNELNTGEKPDLSLQGLRSIFLENLRPEDLQNLDISFVDDRIAKYLTQMACGHQWQTGETPGSNSYNLIRRYFENSGPYGAMETPFGRAAQFVAPAVIEPQAKSTCDIKGTWGPFKYTSIENEVLANADEFLLEEYFETGYIRPEFYFPWFTESGERYDSLAELIYDNLDPMVWENSVGKDLSGFNDWWEGIVQKPVQEVWKTYEGEFKKLYTDKFLPKLAKKGPDTQEAYMSQGLIESINRQRLMYQDQAYQLVDAIERENPSMSLAGPREFLDQVSNLFEERTSLLYQAKKNEYPVVLSNWDSSLVDTPNINQWLSDLIGQDISQIEPDQMTERLTSVLNENQQAQLVMLFQLVTQIDALQGEIEGFNQFATTMEFDSDDKREKVSPEVETPKNPFLPF